MVAMSNPMQAAARPLSGAPPLSVATMDRPNTQIASSSGVPINNMTGRRIGTLTASSRAPSNPPRTEAVNAAPNARLAWPSRAIGWPSRMVAAEPTVPGTPNSTAGMVSEVTVTDARPSISARAEKGSMLKVNGNKSDRPTSPPRPGITPITRPKRTPSTKKPMRVGSVMIPAALMTMGKMSPSIG